MDEVLTTVKRLLQCLEKYTGNSSISLWKFVSNALYEMYFIFPSTFGEATRHMKEFIVAGLATQHTPF